MKYPKCYPGQDPIFKLMLVKFIRKTLCRILRRDVISVSKFLKDFVRSVLRFLCIAPENDTSINERKLRRGHFLLRGKENFQIEKLKWY